MEERKEGRIEGEEEGRKDEIKKVLEIKQGSDGANKKKIINEKV
jgi:hypothetical protein